MTFDEIIMRRLAFIKYLYTVAIEQSQKPEPLFLTSILTFHDAIELFLQLSLEHLDVSRRAENFMDYWQTLKEEKSIELTQKASMRRLNRARGSLKHHGILPSKLVIEGFRASSTNFFIENTVTVFGIEFSDISMIELVQYEEARNNLKEAEKLLKEDNIEEALNNTALAFVQIIDDYENRKRDRFRRSPFFFGESLTFPSSFSMGIEGKLGKFIDRVKESVESIQNAVKILSLGIDYRRYTRFRLLTPLVIRASGGYSIQWVGRGTEGTTLDDAQFCINFVIESAVTIQEFDFSVDSRPKRTLKNEI